MSVRLKDEWGGEETTETFFLKRGAVPNKPPKAFKYTGGRGGYANAFSQSNVRLLLFGARSVFLKPVISPFVTEARPLLSSALPRLRAFRFGVRSISRNLRFHAD